MPPKLRDKGKGKMQEASSKNQISTKPIKSWSEIFQQEANEETSSSKSSAGVPVQDAQDPNEISSQVKKWIESLSQSPEVALAFSQMKDGNPLQKIAAEAVQISKNREIVLHKPKSLANISKQDSLQEIFPKHSQDSTQKGSQYFPNQDFERICVMEDDFNFSEKPPHILAKQILNGQHFVPRNVAKPHEYYMNILIQTGSVAFKHYTDTKDPNFITHSTAQILKVLRPKDWGQNPFTLMKFPTSFSEKITHCTHFSYWNYYSLV